MKDSPLLFLFFLFPASGFAQNLLVNGSFEQAASNGSPFTAVGNYDEDIIPGWETTAANGLIGIWTSGFLSVNAATGVMGSAFDAGQYFAETNGTVAATLFQTVTAPTAGLADYYFLHRGRDGSDTLRFRVIYLGLNGTYETTDALMISRNLSTDNVQSTGEVNGWQLVQGQDVFTTVAGGKYRFEYTAVSAAGGTSQGNFIDNAAFGIGLNPAGVPEVGTSLLARWPLY